MIVTFPHMGTMHVTLEALFKSLHVKAVPPPQITRNTLELGVKYAPEGVCLPFKITLGSFIEALEQGADTIITCGGIGPCRLGYYAAVQKAILQELGFKFEMIAIEPDVLTVINVLRHVAPRASIREIYHAFKLAGTKMKTLDSIEEQVQIVRPIELVQGTIDNIWNLTRKKIAAEDNLNKILEYGAEIIEEINNISIKPNYNPIKIGVIGEIFVMLEPFINQDIVVKLGNMGVQVYKTMFLSDYVQTHLLRKSEYYKRYSDIIETAKPYLRHYVGGHGIKSIGCSIKMVQAGFDGMVHIFPFTCMPEIIAKNILPKVSIDNDIPVLSLAFDEQSGEAGINTRVEAFIDLLKYRRIKNAAK